MDQAAAGELVVDGDRVGGLLVVVELDEERPEVFVVGGPEVCGDEACGGGFGDGAGVEEGGAEDGLFGVEVLVWGARRARVVVVVFDDAGAWWAWVGDRGGSLLEECECWFRFAGVALVAGGLVADDAEAVVELGEPGAVGSVDAEDGGFGFEVAGGCVNHWVAAAGARGGGHEVVRRRLW